MIRINYIFLVVPLRWRNQRDVYEIDLPQFELASHLLREVAVNGFRLKSRSVRKTHVQAQYPVVDCGRSARSIRVTAWQLCWLVVLMTVQFPG